MTIASPLLAPIAVLVAWTLVMMLWLYLLRIPAMLRQSVPMPDGMRGEEIERALGARRAWPQHNYDHLLEQPTLFYAIVLALILMGFDAAINVWLAWIYVGLRIAHSLVQATYNRVLHRTSLFGLSSLALIALTLHAMLYLWHHG